MSAVDKRPFLSLLLMAAAEMWRSFLCARPAECSRPGFPLSMPNSTSASARDTGRRGRPPGVAQERFECQLGRAEQDRAVQPAGGHRDPAAGAEERPGGDRL